MIKRTWLLLLAPVLMGQTTFPDTRSGPFFRHIITAPATYPGCTQTINGQAAPSFTRIIIDSPSPTIPFELTCSFVVAAVNVKSKTTGTITLGFPEEIPPSATRSASRYTLPPGSLRTRASVAAVYTPEVSVSVTPASTYDVILTVGHGNRPGGGSFGNCDTQTQERRSEPKRAINVSLATTCDNESMFEGSVTPHHGFGSPSASNVAQIYTVVTLRITDRSPFGTLEGGSLGELRIESQYKMAQPVLTVSPATLRVAADMGKAQAATATVDITNTAGGYLDWIVTQLSSPATGQAFLHRTVNVNNAGTGYATFSPLRADTIAPRQTSRLTVTIDTSEVNVPGTFRGTFTLRQANVGGSTVIPIEVVIGESTGNDQVSLSSVLPAPGSVLDSNSEQRFSGLARFTLASAAQGTVTLEVADQSGGPPIGRSEAVEINVAGTFEVGLVIPTFTLPATATSLTLKAVLRAGSTVTESAPPVNYTVLGLDSIRIRSYQPLNSNPWWRDVKSPEVVALAEFVLIRAAEAVVIFQLTQDREGKTKPIAATDPIRVTRVQQNKVTRGVIPPELVSTIQEDTIFLTAFLVDSTNGEELAKSEAIEYRFEPKPKVNINVGEERIPEWISFDPATLLDKAGRSIGTEWSTSGDHPAIRVSWDSGAPVDAGYFVGQILNGVVTSLIDGGARWVTPPRPELVFNTGEAKIGFADSLEFTGWIRNKSGQNVFSDPIKIKVEAIAATASPPLTTVRVGQPAQQFKHEVKWITNRENLRLVRVVNTKRRISGEITTRTSIRFPVSLGINQIEEVPFVCLRDPDICEVPYEVESITVHYELEDGNDSTSDTRSERIQYDQFQFPVIITKDTEATINFPGGVIDKAKSTVGGVVRSLVTAVALDGIDKLLNARLPPKNAPNNAFATAPELIGIRRTWQFDPPIPANGSFTGNLALNYSERDLPDDPNFDESQMRIVSYDASTGQTTVLPTVLDRTQKTATTPLDRLAPYYSLAVQGPFTRSMLSTPVASSSWTQSLALVNTGTADAESFLTTHRNDGTIAQLPDTQNPATARIARSTQIVTPGPDSGNPGVQIATDSTVAGVAILTTGTLLEALDLTRAPAYLGILPDIVRSANTTTEIHLANTANARNEIRLGLWNSDGTSAGVRTVALESKARYGQPVEALFPSMPEKFNGYITFEAPQGAAAAQIVQSGATASALGAQALQAPATTSTRLFAPNFSAGSDLPATILNLVNPTTLDANVVINAFAESGARVGAAVGVAVAAGRQYRANVADIFSLSGGAPVIGSLVIESTIRGLVGNVVIEDPLGGTRYRTALPLDLEPSRSWLIPYVSNAEGQVSGLVVQNTASAPANVQARMVRGDGTTVGTVTPLVPANGSYSGLLAASLPASAGQRGYLLIDADQPIIPFSIFSRTDGATDIGAVLPQPVPGSAPAPPPSVPSIDVSPASLDFGAVTTGQTKDLVLTVRNNGNATLTVNSVTSSNPRFAMVVLSTPFNVGAGSLQYAIIRFSPTSAGLQTGTVTIASNDPATPSVTINVTGTGAGSAQGPIIEVTPASLDFGTVTSGQTKDLTLLVRNNGNATLTVNSITSSNVRFALAISGTPFNVGQGSFQNAIIRFSPIAAGAQSGTLTIASNDPAKPSVTINVAGAGAGGGGGGSTPDPNVLKVDDGVFELTTGFNQGGVQGYFVNRLTPMSYPATLRKVILLFPPSGPPSGGLPLGTAIQLISATTASTSDPLTGLAFTRANSTVTAFDTFIEYDVPALTIQSGSFVVGFTVLNPPGVFPALLDTSSQSARRSYVSQDGATFFLVDSIAGVGPGNFGIRARVEYTGSGGGTSTRVGTTVAAGWPNGRESNNLPPAAIDGNTATFTWTTESYASANPSYLGVGFAAATSISRIRLFKDNDAGGPGLIAKNLVIEYTTTPTSTPLSARVWTPVTGLSNGFQGAELLTATSVNANGTVAADSHNSLASGWASLTFNAVSATGIRIGFSNATPIPYNHYRVYEFEVYSGGSGGGTEGGGAITVTVTPSSVAPGGQVTVTWNAPGRNVVNDWVGLYRLGAAINSENLLRPTWESVFQSSGSKTFTMPAAPGDYVFHYFTSSGYDLGATSNTIVSR
ncbi:MAG: choice-of-anchor D domain-containing protein [Acidobacteriia bacterium]|nr:choice-of-anchor D domain-containing protein [Terriglobia bacterium]